MRYPKKLKLNQVEILYEGKSIKGELQSPENTNRKKINELIDHINALHDLVWELEKKLRNNGIY